MMSWVGWRLLAAFLGILSLHSAEAGEELYTVGLGDKLAISVLGKPDLSGTFDVRENGTIVLHLLGAIEVAGDSVSQIEEKILDRAEKSFTSNVSVLVSLAEYRSIFVLGAVHEPDAYPFRPGMNVIKAIAVAGGLRSTAGDEVQPMQLEEANRRALQAQSRVRFAAATQAAIGAELARLESGAGPEEEQSDAEGSGATQRDLVALRRALLERSMEGSEQRSSLAEEEAALFSKRRQLIASQLRATEEQMHNIEGLVTQGLARRDQYLDLQVDADEFRSDELEAAAFEARARQTAVNAQNEARVERTRYHQELLADKIAADEQLELAQVELRTSLEFLRQAEVAAAQGLEGELITILEIYPEGGDKAPERAELTTPLGPGDVLNVRYELAIQ